MEFLRFRKKNKIHMQVLTNLRNRLAMHLTLSPSECFLILIFLPISNLLTLVCFSEKGFPPETAICYSRPSALCPELCQCWCAAIDNIIFTLFVVGTHSPIYRHSRFLRFLFYFTFAETNFATSNQLVFVYWGRVSRLCFQE